MESTTRYGKHCKTNRKSLPWCALANSTSTATVKNSSSSPEKQNRKCSSTTPSANSYHPAPKARNNHKQTASGDGELWTCKQGKAEHSLDTASSQSSEPREGRLWQSPPNPSFIQPIESIQSIGSIASIHPGKSNILFWSCLL